MAHLVSPITPPVTPVPTTATAASETKLSEAEFKTELADLNAPPPPGAPASSSSESELNRLEAAASAADAPPASAQAPADPAAVMALADLAISAIGQLAPSEIELPEHLVKLTPQERAILTPFAIKAAPKFAEMTAGLDQHAHLVFLGLVGWFGFVRWQAIQKLEKLIEARTVVSASPERAPENPKDSQEAHPGRIFNGRMPGSPF
jgi:hypothetical protein